MNIAEFKPQLWYVAAKERSWSFYFELYYRSPCVVAVNSRPRIFILHQKMFVEAFVGLSVLGFIVLKYILPNPVKFNLHGSHVLVNGLILMLIFS